MKKPAPEDFYDVADQNGNADLVDAALHGLEAGKAALGEDGRLPSALLPELDFVPNNEKGAAGGVAQLDGTGRVPAGQLPEMNYEGPLKNAGVKDGIADGDGVAVTDSADGGRSKRVLWSTVKTALGALFRPSTWVPAWGDVTGKPGTFPPSGHQHGAGDITSGTLAVARGGTGQTSVQALRNSMGLGNTTGAVPIANGGTGATTAAAGRSALGAVANYIVSITIPTGTWTADTGGGYYKDITVANMTATVPVKMDFAITTDKAAGELMVSEFLSNVLRIEQMAGKVRVHTYASGKAPSVNIPVRLSWTA